MTKKPQLEFTETTCARDHTNLPAANCFGIAEAHKHQTW
jgi:hypothetical protein